MEKEKVKRYKPKSLRDNTEFIWYGVGKPPSNMYGPFGDLADALEVVPRYNNLDIFEIKTNKVIYKWDEANNEWVLLEEKTEV